ncbi:hypothetical protein BDP55DRAFT_639918 [Colletotrichum godetiae]|uniref:Uncharacterized protein n=1 Tax=Colletotrichum godetiae TaxID=1209918 RepID=A0AAJ0AZ71_9PEZI|nr:uncharacterized protein BDP55DRAFT_639918 [Colletotrichum godetiae]KAK1700925.1 hypothetical protein BDP55DRAFT_639918 [Colletotrichum godetiae]
MTQPSHRRLILSSISFSPTSKPPSIAKYPPTYPQPPLSLTLPIVYSEHSHVEPTSILPLS